MRRLSEIAAEVRKDWHPINNGAAVIALDAMASMGSISAPYFLEPHGYGVVSSFLNNAKGWHGPVARRVKAELRAMFRPKDSG
ncbi:hypothetical protein Bsp3421_000235 (plasmid) [Burkholderia sp. FERM BP-3421]|uniref:hypothetical protein n=1 Tax=Burkholderia sp. FERM BP-3421 TaxID=1494466 RepID=UPI00235F2301|nr:hypothetical protein [Burkholderia sp. FERM BP-3421]WDD90398.1 hypothetical protein Bsp3421_000235 [Burkholderia sp. FERM BP-3421]